MRKHGSRGAKASSRLVLETGQRRRIQLNFEPGRKACLWVLDEQRPRVSIRH
jgi:ABC-type transport system involved in cytochrome c biogenesis ATPase subunit